MIPLPIATAAIKSIKYDKVSTIEVLNSLSSSLFPSKMSESVKNLAVFYGTRCEVFDLNRAQSLEEFIEETFGIDKVFEEKLVVGWMLPEKGKNIPLSNLQDAEEFTTSRDSERPRIVLIYDKPETEDQPQNDFKVSRGQWEELVNAVRELQPSLEAKKSGSSVKGPVHHGSFCDACYPKEAAKTGIPIVGTRFKCQDCKNFDLCSSCKAKGVELKSHKNDHSMTRIDTPLPKRTSGESDAFTIFVVIFMILFGICIFVFFVLTLVPVWDVVIEPLVRRYIEFLYSTLEYYF